MVRDEAGLDQWLRAWLPSQRWFADKSRSIASTDVVLSHSIGEAVTVAVVRVAFQDAASADYVVPYRGDDGFTDATTSPAFLRWLALMLSGAGDWDGAVRHRRLADPPVDIAYLAAKPLAVEQSNTSIRYGAEWLAKLNRRLSYGPSPELELTALLNRWRGEPCSPRTVAALDIRTDRGKASLAILAEFMSNEGDGWATMLGLLRAASHSDDLEGDDRSLAEVRALAELTADLHSALSLDPWTGDLAPERITRQLAADWEAATTSSLDATMALVAASLPDLDGRSRRVAELLGGSVENLHQRVAGFQALVGSRRIRVHGDYHLGQTLRTSGGRYVAIDFDGEPQRTLEERRAKYSPLRDVAGMMRSLSYAVGTVQAERNEVVEDAALPAWERTARARFLDAYLARLAANGADLLPREPDRLRQALDALELEKAIYEVAYELNNRPGWAWIPLEQLVRSG